MSIRLIFKIHLIIIKRIYYVDSDCYYNLIYDYKFLIVDDHQNIYDILSLIWIKLLVQEKI